ncbi:MAG: hypothetical protein HYY96_09290 [Candidatus Tectomicrobia bacterium]|nr:hypothetical protein [Candidatus Tectomicrobia bacterium]
MRNIRHLSPRYIASRLMVLTYEHTNKQTPWLTKSMTNILSSWLKPEDKVLEWGSGRSTLWFSTRVKFITSIEHDPYWYRRVSRRIQRMKLTHVDYHLCDESKYVERALSMQKNSLDLILVDGIRRDECAVVALSLLKPGGIIVIDNCNWFLPSASRSPNSQRYGHAPPSESWQTFQMAVGDWRCIWTSSGVTDTALWMKP